MKKFDPFMIEVLEAIPEDDPEFLSTIDTLVALSERSRSEGILALEDEIPELSPPFLQIGIQLITDGTDSEEVAGILGIARHAKGLTPKERALRLMIEEGVLGIQSGSNPRDLKVRLLAFLGEKRAIAAFE